MSDPELWEAVWEFLHRPGPFSFEVWLYAHLAGTEEDFRTALALVNTQRNHALDALIADALIAEEDELAPLTPVPVREVQSAA